MIYIDDTFKDLKDENGLKLCKAWFLTFNGEKYNKKLYKLLDFVNTRKVSIYKITQNDCILLLNKTYVVADGKGRIIYSPLRYNEDVRNYLDGKTNITEKYEVNIIPYT